MYHISSRADLVHVSLEGWKTEMCLFGGSLVILDNPWSSTYLVSWLGLSGWISRGKSFPPGPCLAGRKYYQMLEVGKNKANLNSTFYTSNAMVLCSIAAMHQQSNKADCSAVWSGKFFCDWKNTSQFYFSWIVVVLKSLLYSQICHPFRSETLDNRQYWH